MQQTDALEELRMGSIGERLREERERTGLIQAAFAELAGVTKTAQFNYEKGHRAPDALYLSAIAAAGVDVLYVLTGSRRPTAADSLTAQESAHLERYRALSPAVRAAVDTLTEALALQGSPT